MKWVGLALLGIVAVVILLLALPQPKGPKPLTAEQRSICAMAAATADRAEIEPDYCKDAN